MKTYTFKSKIIISIAVIFLAILSIVVGYNSVSRLNSENENAIANANLIAENFSYGLKNKIDYTFDALRVLSDNIVAAKGQCDRDGVNRMLTTMLKNNPDFLSTYTMWLPNAFDNKDKLFVNKPGHDITGRFIPCWTRKGSNEFVVEANRDYEVEGTGDVYLNPKKTKKECITEPYFYVYESTGKNTFIISLGSPLLINGEFNGITGVDYEVSFVQKMATSLKSKIYAGQSEIEIYSNKGVIVGSTLTPDSVGKNLNELDYADVDDIIKKIQRGRSEVKRLDDRLVITKPLLFGRTDTPWQIKISVPFSEINKKSRSVILFSILTGLILLFLGLLLIYIFVSNLTKPLNRLVEQTKKIAEGDLTGNIDYQSKDEVGLLAKSFNKMVGKLRDIIQVVAEGANNVVISTSQMSSTALQLAQGANEQAAASEEVSASIEEMSSSIQQNSDNAAQTEMIAKDAAEGIGHVSDATKKSVNAIKDIAARITIINDIAEKTDILAINAAIEAARAGEHGKGFAVVAAEVRKLAEITQKAAREINELSRTNLNITEEASVLMQGVIPNIKKTAQLVQEISAASSEQSSGSMQIAKAIEQLSQVTQQNSAAAEEMSTGSEELMSQAEILKDAISFFKIDKMSSHTQPPSKSTNAQETHHSKKTNVYIDMGEHGGTDDGYERM